MFRIANFLVRDHLNEDNTGDAAAAQPIASSRQKVADETPSGSSEMVIQQSVQYLTFQTPDSPDPSEWSSTGAELRRWFASALGSAGYETNLDTDPHDPDWVFNAKYAGQSFLVVLVLDTYSPCTWLIGLQDCPYRARSDVLSALGRAVSEFPNTSDIRWHSDHTTLPAYLRRRPTKRGHRVAARSPWSFIQRLLRW